jgi:hypothetical protein
LEWVEGLAPRQQANTNPGKKKATVIDVNKVVPFAVVAG